MTKLLTIKYEDLTKEKLEELKIVFWGDENEEQLSWSEIDEAIESVLDAGHPDPFPDSVTVCGYVRREVNEEFDIKQEQILEDVLERLDEEYGGPNGDLTKPTEKMIEAAATFARVVAEEYFVWSCEGVILVELTDVVGWVKENCPHWIEEMEKAASKEKED